MKTKIYFFLLSAIFIGGCASTSNVQADKHICLSEPSWVLNPPHDKNSLYGVGIAPENFNGIQAQRKSAISKAINEIATQLRTTVNSQYISYESQNNGTSDKTYKNISFQTVDKENVNAKIVEFCKNPNTGNLYVLMRMVK